MLLWTGSRRFLFTSRPQPASPASSACRLARPACRNRRKHLCTRKCPPPRQPLPITTHTHTHTRLPLSPEASCVSFGAFLHSCFGAAALAVGGHPLCAGCVRYFGLGRTVMCIHQVRRGRGGRGRVCQRGDTALALGREPLPRCNACICNQAHRCEHLTTHTHVSSPTPLPPGPHPAQRGGAAGRAPALLIPRAADVAQAGGG